MDPVEALFRQIDASLASRRLPRVQLQVVGSTALFAQTPWRRGTKDSDAVESWGFDPHMKTALLELAGVGTALARRVGVYLEFVGQGLLLLPEAPTWNPWLSLSHLDVAVLDPVDVAVAKLARLHSDDLLDIEAMVARQIITHAMLVDRFRSAAHQHGLRGMGHTLPRAIANLHRVERDLFVVDVTEIELPGWMDP